MDKRFLAFGIAIILVGLIVGLILASGYAPADTFDERFSSGVLTPAPAPAPPSEQWGIKLLLLIDGKVMRAVTYNGESYPSGEACRAAALADTKLQASAQAIAGEAIQTFGPDASVAIACAMELN
jgi:hypothetical protein